MSRVSAKLRRGPDRHFHWCPACEELHPLPDSWHFDGNVDAPTFTPNFRHPGMKTVVVSGKWTGEWERDASGDLIPRVCHDTLTAGRLRFWEDSTHGLAGKT